MARVVENSDGIAALVSHVHSVIGQIPDAQLNDARRAAPRDTGALAASGRVLKRSASSWRIYFGQTLPDARAVYTEVGTGPHFHQPPMVDTDFSPLKGERPGNTPAFAYIRQAMYRERTP